ncbi:MAG: hypothetical protein R8J85_09235 [Mariprofundales bacterium]
MITFKQIEKPDPSPREPYGVKETSHNLRLLLLAVRLQRPVKRLPAHLIAAERITRASLAEEYCSEGNSKSMAAAKKMAGRHLQYMQEVFGLDGDGHSGFVMAKRFDSYREMLAYWLHAIGTPKGSDKRLHVMLSGLLVTIRNGFSQDPVAIPTLARELKKRYGNQAIRDTREPLDDLFANQVISSWLSLYEDDEGTIGIDRELDPLLLRLRRRAEVGCNEDRSIALAVPGRIKHVLAEHCQQMDEAHHRSVLRVAEAVRDSHCWWNVRGQRCVPFILFREGSAGPLMLTLWNSGEQMYQDVLLDQLEAFPWPCKTRFRPFGIDGDLQTMLQQWNE